MWRLSYGVLMERSVHCVSAVREFSRSLSCGGDSLINWAVLG